MSTSTLPNLIENKFLVKFNFQLHCHVDSYKPEHSVEVTHLPTKPIVIAYASAQDREWLLNPPPSPSNCLSTSQVCIEIFKPALRKLEKAEQTQLYTFQANKQDSENPTQDNLHQNIK